jgi:hypothetical protein
MTEDEQEALSARYIMPRIMRLTSGNIALFVDGEDLQIFPVDAEYLRERLLDAIPTYETLAARDVRAAPKGRLTSLNLADLGL